MSLCLSTGTMTTMASSSPRRDRPPRPRSPRANWQKWRGRRPPGGEGGRAGAAGVSAVGRAQAHCQHRHARSSRDTAPRGETQSRGAVREGDAGRCSRLSHQHPGNPSPRCASGFSSERAGGTALRGAQCNISWPLPLHLSPRFRTSPNIPAGSLGMSL